MKKRFLPRRIAGKRAIKRATDKDFFVGYVLENGKLKKVRVSKKQELKDIGALLKEDKEFLDIMERL